MAWNILFTFDLDEQSKPMQSKFNDELLKQGFTPFTNNAAFSFKNNNALRPSHALQSAKHKVRLAQEKSQVKLAESAFQTREEHEASTEILQA